MSRRTDSARSRPNIKHFDHTRDEFSPYGLTCELWGPVKMHRPDRHNEVELNLLPQGELTYLMWGERRKVRAGRLACFWAAVPHQIIEFKGISSYHVATIPLAWVLGWGLPERFVSALLDGEILEETLPYRGRLDESLMSQWEADLASGRATEPVILEMKARLLRLAQTFRPRESAPKEVRLTAGHAEAVETMAKFVAENYTGRITVSQVAASAGLNPDHATRIFKKVYHKGIKAFITEHRVLHAQRMLLSTDAKTLTIAMESGFGSLGRFNANFKSYCGCSPSEYRAIHRAQ